MATGGEVLGNRKERSMEVRSRLVFGYWVEVFLTVLLAAGIVYGLDVLLRAVFFTVSNTLAGFTKELLTTLRYSSYSHSKPKSPLLYSGVVHWTLITHRIHTLRKAIHPDIWLLTDWNTVEHIFKSIAFSH